MAHRRSPRCTYCYNVGHTRRSCPTMRERAAAAASKPSEQRDWNDVRAIEQAAYYKDSMNGKSRSCNYCDATGHNIKGCAVRKSDIKLAISHLMSWRKSFFEHVASVGCGLGALMRHKMWVSGFGYPESPNSHYAMIIGMNDGANFVYWNVDSTGNLYGIFRARLMQDFEGRRSEHELQLPEELVASFCPIAEGTERYRSWHNQDPVAIECHAYNAEFDVERSTSYAACEAMVTTYYAQKFRGNRPVSRQRAINDRVVRPEFPNV